VVVASHDLLSGSRIGTGDVRVVRVAPDLVPAGATKTLTGVVDRVVAGPMRAGEPVTDQRVLGAPLIAGYPPDMVAAPVRIQDGDVVSLLRVGDRIDIYSSNGDPTVPAPRVATDVAVVSLPVSGDSATDGALVVVAVTQIDAARLAQASATTQLTISLRG
jgi:pilus assembly protein CpaB